MISLTIARAARAVAARRIPWTNSITTRITSSSSTWETISSPLSLCHLQFSSFSTSNRHQYQQEKQHDNFTRDSLIPLPIVTSDVKSNSVNVNTFLNSSLINNSTNLLPSSSTQHHRNLMQSNEKPRNLYRRTIYTNSSKSSIIHKQRTLKTRTRFQQYATSNGTNKNGMSTSTRVTWREALKSPLKALYYTNQLRVDLWDWAKHMWAGAKLLAADVRVSTQILKRITHGKQITRRERNFIVHTGVDLARLLPFSLFLIIPLAEIALPLALRFFPNMLPSQFQHQMKSDENLKKRLKARLELAKYLREVVEEKAKNVQSSDVNSELKKNAEDLTAFLNSIRSGQAVSAADISRFAKFFNDELTIDGAARPQLVAMSKYMGISHYGHDSFLRFKLRSRLNAIKNDDMQIMWEGGVDSLTDSEVAKACRDRGIREEISNTVMRKELNDWLELSQKREIPGSLMIMSRAFMYGRTGEEKDDEISSEEIDEGEQQQVEDSLKDTLESMPEDVIMDVKQAADGGGKSNAERLEETLRQAKLIELESERIERKEKEDDEKRKKREENEEKEVQEKESLEGHGDKKATHDGTGTSDSISDKEVLQHVEKAEQKLRQEVMATSGTSDENLVSDISSITDVVMDEEEEVKKRDRIRGMLISMGQMTSDSSVESEREELRNLKKQLTEAEELMKGDNGDEEKNEAPEMRRFKSLVRTLEREVEKVDAKVGLRMKLLDHDNDGVMSLDECRNAMMLIVKNGDDHNHDDDENVVSQTLQRLDADADGNISRADLARLLHEMQFEYGVIETPKEKGND